MFVIGLSVLTYGPVRHFDFAAYDDYEFVVENPHVATGVSVDNIGWALEHPYSATGGPLTWLSHMLDVEWFGLEAGAHHVTNVVLHALGSVLLLWALHLITGSVIRSTVVAALFAVHPLHVESVAWIAERKDVLSGVWWFAAMAAYGWYAKTLRWSRYLVVLTLYILGLLSKPMVATLPFALLLLDRWPLGRLRFGETSPLLHRVVLEKVPMVILGVCALGLTLIAQQATGAVAAVDAVPLGSRLANAAVSYVAYLQKTVWPTGLIPYYPFRVSIPPLVIVAALAFLTTVTAAAVRMARSRPELAFGWLWYLGTLVPVIGLVQVGGHAMADRFTYLPSVGIFVAVVWLTADVARRWIIPVWFRFAIGGAVIAAAALTARAQVYHWRDGLTLWQHTVTVDPNNARGHSNLGAVLAKRGRPVEAMRSYETAIRLHPDVPQTHSNLGQALEDTGRLDDAVEHYREALRIDPSYVRPRARLANILAESGATAEAITQFREALRLSPLDPLLHVNMAVTLGRSGHPDEGIVHMREAVRLQPDNAQWRYFAALMALELGRVGEARALLQVAVRIDPTHAEAARALAEIGR